jgi:predicted HTH transcriptional regulator
MSDPFDSSACPAATLTDLSSDNIQRFLTLARTRGLPLPERATPREVLDCLNLVNQDRPTNAAVLLFGHHPQRFLPSAKIECAHFQQTTAGQPQSQQICDGTLFEMMNLAMYFVLSRLSKASGAYEIPLEAVREALVNAVAHRNYADASHIKVTLSGDRLEIYSPGGLPPSLNLGQLRGPHSSMPPNPLLAEPLYLAANRASKGTGTTDMIELCRKAGLPEPVFALNGGFLVTLPRRPAPEPVAPEVMRLLKACKADMTREQLQDALQLKGLANFRKLYLAPALEGGFIEMTIPDKPQSHSQKYRLTAKGKAALASLL